MKKILVIKHGSLGDIVFALPCMSAIRKKYKNYSIHLLTEKKYASFLKKSPYFDKIIQDDRKNFFSSFFKIFKLSSNKYEIVIDLQNSQRTSAYNFLFRIFSKSLICSSRPFSHLRYIIPKQGAESTTKGLFNQLNLLNIENSNIDNYDWLKINLENDIEGSIALFIPGVSKGNEFKKWQSEKFADIAEYCELKNYKICLVGTELDLISAKPILKKCKNIINKIDHSPPEVIYSIALKSKIIFSNDTGPGHIASLSGKTMIWLLNDNKISKANIIMNDNSHRITSKTVKNILSKDVIKYLENKNLVNTIY